MNIQDLQTAFDNAPEWERMKFIEDNGMELSRFLGIGRPDLEELNTEEIAWWLIASGMLSTEELLDAVVDDIDVLRSAIYEIEEMEEEEEEEEQYDEPY